MLRLSPLTAHERLVKTDALKMAFAGAESNAAVSLAILGHETYFVTCLPPNPLGDAAENSLREFGVNTQYILRAGKRIGTYFIEYGASIRPTRVIYDRENSAIAQVKPGSLDWETILRGKDWLNFTGITPALSAACAKECVAAAKVAQQLGVKVSFDLNYRRTLWTEKEARRVISDILPHVNVLFANAGSAYDVFGIQTRQPGSWEEHLGSTRDSARALADLFDFDLIALTVRDHLSASDNVWAGMLYDNQTFFESRRYEFELVERLGGGDSFMAGVLHGLGSGWDHPRTIEFATAASALKHTIPGDLNLLTEAEIAEVAGGEVSGKVKR